MSHVMSMARLKKILETDPDFLLTPGEVATFMRVDPKTVTRWCATGRIPNTDCTRTPGGHRRIKAIAIKRLWEGETPREAQPGDSEGSLREQG